MQNFKKEFNLITCYLRNVVLTEREKELKIRKQNRTLLAITQVKMVISELRNWQRQCISKEELVDPDV